MDNPDCDPRYFTNDVDGIVYDFIENFVSYFPSDDEMKNPSRGVFKLIVLTFELKDYNIFYDLFNQIHEKLSWILFLCKKHNIDITDFLNIVSKYDGFYFDKDSGIFQFFIGYDVKIQFKFSVDYFNLIYYYDGDCRIVCRFFNGDGGPKRAGKCSELNEYFSGQRDNYNLDLYIKTCSNFNGHLDSIIKFVSHFYGTTSNTKARINFWLHSPIH